MMTDNEWVVRLKNIIVDRDKTIKQVADSIGMSEANLYKCFKRGSIEIKHLLAIANYFNISVKYFFEDSPSGKANAASIGNSNTTIAVAEGGSNYEVTSRKQRENNGEKLFAENEMLKRLIAEKDLLIAEKERMIQVLLKK